MSSKEDLKIQADDITIVQGEKAKDYNVIVTSNDDAPLSGIPITIAFYNNDYTFEREATTNEYGVASVPLYLGGDAWFVDVHFKGNEQYKPQLVTKEIIIEKFERLDSYITSENLVINIDEQSMDGTYYTVYLKDSYDRPIANEPVNVVVEQTGVDNPQTYIDVVIRTDDDGKVEVPYLSHNENVQVTTQYRGCTRFKPCINADIVAFEEVEPRNTIEFNIDTTIDLRLEYRINGGGWEDLGDEDRVFLDFPIVNIDSRYYHDYNVGWFYFDSMEDGTYNITIGCESGINDIKCYPFYRTFTVTNPYDTRKTLSEWIEYQGGSEEDELTISSRVDGTLSHIKLVLDYELPYAITTLDITGSSRRFFTLPTYEESDGFYKKTVLEFDVVNPPRDITWGNSLSFFQESNSFISGYGFGLVKSITIINNSRTTPTLTQTGFAEQGQTYQNLNILASVSDAPMHTKINDYCILTFVNFDTMELFNYYSYLVDNVTPVPLSFNLGVGYWRMVIISKDTNQYKGGYLKAEAQLSTDTPVVPPSDNIIVNSENYIDLGTDSPTFVDDTITTATTDDDIHSIMALEFTNSNYYRLSFNAEVTGDSTIIYGADPTLTTMDGLFINTNEITLYNDGIEMDKLIFDTPIFNQANNNVLFQRYGNQFTIFVNDEQVYKTELLSWNTFGVYQDATGSEIELSHFVLEPYITTEITPSVADYDGTIFGSDIRLEIKDNQLDLIDYGMLPQGAIGGGKIILNDIPLNDANKYALRLEMRYNNTRFERLNNLTGEMQMRIYEDISTSDAVKDYAKALCSPMPVPNSKTVFTRHSDEGTLYFVQDPFDSTPTYLTNGYHLYKGGVEITTETGISLFNLDNAYSPVYVGNELVRAEFHRRSGFIRISRYDETSGDWATVNTLKLKNYPQLSLNEYNDDYAEIQFGQTVWKFYRGRPFIIINHPKDDLKIMNLADRVYCETVENQRSMGFIEEHDAMCSVFNPQLSIQQFEQELHIGQNIRLDNFEIYDVDNDGNIGDPNTESALGILQVDNDNALLIDKINTGSYLALNFPSYANYVKRIGDTFTLLVGYVDSDVPSYTIKARGFDDRGAVPIIDGIQYGIWEQTKTANRFGGASAYNVSANDLYMSYVAGTSTKTGTITETNGVITITNNDFDTISTVTVDVNHINTYDYSFTYPTIVEFDLLDFTSPQDAPTNTRLQFYDRTNNSTCSLNSLGKGHIKAIVYDNKQEFYCNDVLVATRNMTVDNFRIALQTHTYIKIANLQVYTSNGRYIEDEQLYISKVNNVDTASITTSTVGGVEQYTITHNPSLIDSVGTVSILESGNTQYEYNSAMLIEFDIVSYTNPTGANVSTRFQCYDRTNNATCTFARLTDNSGHIKVIVEDGKQEYYCDDVLKYTTNLTLNDFRISWQTYGELTIKNIRIANYNLNNEIRATFTDCPSEVKYLDFIITINTNDSTDIIMKDLMYYDGDAIINHDIDTSRVYAEQVEVQFADTYTANIYNDKSNCGLCIGRPYQEPFSLRKLTASKETVLIPYMKNCKEWDKPSQVFLEYLNANRQVIDIDWEN